MRARDRLNVAFGGGSLVIAGLLGLWADSCGVFVAAALVLRALNIWNDELRF